MVAGYKRHLGNNTDGFRFADAVVHAIRRVVAQAAVAHAIRRVQIGLLYGKSWELKLLKHLTVCCSPTWICINLRSVNLRPILITCGSEI